ncbi:tetratricopeptide repeat protein [Chondromyces crocatus]|uniref:Outer membrane lipoprotein BamD-like domain-containing protein n=1 Tax=Chondromyces crocatus TaxID=52 RepID=A0A0K1EEX9_CHOCO|nr:tetratricopeptide repeat protein [Chondromyces crocatus]AKT39409.1 uncharacterized protein CMC5_035560 [Chondromyces crocatus]
MRWFHASALAVVVAATVGCASMPAEVYVHSFASGQRAFHAGRYKEAARAFTEAATKADRVKDRDEAYFMAARAHERDADWASAQRAYEQLVAASPKGPRAVRAEFELAELAIRQGDETQGFAQLFAALRRHPEHGFARRALRMLVDHQEALGGPAGAVSWLEREGSGLRGTELDQMVRYELGRAEERAGDRARALRTLLDAARAHPYPTGPLTDNALFHAARLAEELGRPEEAISILRELLAPRETASTGSYERPLFDDAQLRIAQIYRDTLKDHASARREFRRLYEKHRTSLMRDDVLWAEAKLWLEDGQQREACSVAALLRRDFPESRYARCAHRLCPTLEASGKPCAAYIERDLTQKDDEGER